MILAGTKKFRAAELRVWVLGSMADNDASLAFGHNCTHPCVFLLQTEELRNGIGSNYKARDITARVGI